MHSTPARPPLPGPSLPRHPARDGRVDLLLVYAVHDALRRDMRRLLVWSQSCFPVTTPAWTDFQERLRTHLAAERTTLWPVLRHHRLPDGAGPFERGRRRVTLLAVTVDDCLAGRGPASRTAEYMTALDEALTAYLDDQQTLVLPLLEQHITAGDWADYDAAQRQPFGLASGAALCAWLLDEAPPERREAIRRLFPPGVRVAYRWWERRRARNVVATAGQPRRTSKVRR